MLVSDNGIVYADSEMSGMPKITTAAGSLITILDLVLPTAGFSKVFDGTNKAVYRSDDPAGTRLYLRIDDTYGSYARILGYEVMTDVDTGTGPFPTNAQLSGGGYVQKTASISQVWVLYADSRWIYFFCEATNELYFFGYASGFVFGDPVSLMPNDPYGCYLQCSVNTVTSLNFHQLLSAGNKYLARSYTQSGEAIASTSYSHANTNNQLGNINHAYPSPVDGRLHLYAIECWNTTLTPRGVLPGAWNHLHAYNNFTHGDILTENHDLPGRSLRVQTSGTTYKVIMDITGPWRDDGTLGIAGKVTELLVPGAYQVNLFRQFDMQLLKTAWSDANGDYAFTGLKSQKYVVMAIDHTDPLRSPAIQDNVTPS